MGKARPERELVINKILEDPYKKAFVIAKEIGLDKTMGDDDKATDYVRNVRRSIRKSGYLVEHSESLQARDKERLEDIKTILKMRKGRIAKKELYYLMLLNCYYRLRSKDDDTHWTAIDTTYQINEEHDYPFSWGEAISICDIALAKYTDSIDEAKTAEAKKQGLPNAGLNYSDSTLYYKLGVRDKELPYLKTIKKP